MEALERRRFLDCLKTDVDLCTITELTYWLPGMVVWNAYKADYLGMRSLDRGQGRTLRRADR